MPASGAVDGGLCAVGAGGEVERGVGRYSSAIYRKEKGMNELERTALNEILRTVTYIAERVDRLGEQLYPHLTETDKKEVLALINDALSKGRGISDNDLDGVKVQSNAPQGIEGVR
ncbi:hypothetical protein HCC27_08920 [Streptococcus suis]|nr:hypothetical protein [Streptococcus suis]MCK3921949.1 hypothetical protein [Streptococcus suis]HEL1936505.1 hypothetical protein [Streptococcus suis]HEL2280041.1 hypothetical protein [Streptococcus suis]HEL2282046.1 hypothetical protein [Streptococcus suis]HEL2291976.1 hypothetical protein [Streptococcus suis]